MEPVQILLNNLLYTFSQATIATDNVDQEYLERPKQWDISFIRNFMILQGPISSVFDYLTFFLMLFFFFHVTPSLNMSLISTSNQQQFQTAWFIESLLTQTLVVFVIRTRISPFWKSKPGKYLTASSLAVVAIALIIPYTPLGSPFHFTPPPPLFYLFLATYIGAYLFLAETAKRWFYRRHAFRIEQTLVPRRKAVYLSRAARLVQDMTAVICLRPETEISFDSLVQDLSASVNYQIDSEQVLQSLQYLRRGQLVSIDWYKKTVRRESAIKDFVLKRIAPTAVWSLVVDDWVKITRTLQEKYGQVNPDFQEILNKTQN
jgi:hypothetical protein